MSELRKARIVWLAVAIALLLVLIIASATFVTTSVINNQATINSMIQTRKSVYETNTGVIDYGPAIDTAKPWTKTPTPD
jgi:hypothetical protein